MHDLSNVEVLSKVADTAYCFVHEGLLHPTLAGDLPRRCAVKLARREDEATLALMEAEYDRIRRLFGIDLGDSPPLVPEPFALGKIRGSTALVMEWVAGDSVEIQTSRGRPNPKPARYVVQAFRRLLAMLDFAHARDGLNCVLPDFKRDAIILSGAGARILDWNVVHRYDDGDANRDFQAGLHVVTEMAVGTRLGSFAAAREALGWLPDTPEDQLTRTLFEHAYAVAERPGQRDELRQVYQELRGLAVAYEDALARLHQASLGVGDAAALRREVTEALTAARERSRRGEPPYLALPPAGALAWTTPPAAGLGAGAQRGPAPRLETALELFVEAGFLRAEQVRLAPPRGAAAPSWNSAPAPADRRPPPARREQAGVRQERIAPAREDVALYRELAAIHPQDGKKLTARVEDLRWLAQRYPGYSDDMPNLHHLLGQAMSIATPHTPKGKRR